MYCKLIYMIKYKTTGHNFLCASVAACEKQTFNSTSLKFSRFLMSQDSEEVKYRMTNEEHIYLFNTYFKEV